MEISRVAIHEAGHAVVGEKLGRRVAWVTLESSPGMTAGCAFEPSPAALKETPNWRACDLIVTAAGMAAERLALGSHNRGYVKAESAPVKSDRVAKLIDATYGAGMASANAARTGGDTEYLEEWAAKLSTCVSSKVNSWILTAAEIIMKDADAFLRVARELHERRTLTGEEVRQTMRKTHDTNGDARYGR